MLTSRGQGKGWARVCFDWIKFSLQPLATNLFPPLYLSHISLPHSYNLLECHRWTPLPLCCLSLHHPAVCLIPQPITMLVCTWFRGCYSLLWNLAVSRRWQGFWVTSVTDQMPHRGADLSDGQCWRRQPPCRLSPLPFQPQRHPLQYSPPPFFYTWQ